MAGTTDGLERVGAFFVEPYEYLDLQRGGLFTRGVVKAGVDDLDRVSEILWGKIPMKGGFRGRDWRVIR